MKAVQKVNLPEAKPMPKIKIEIVVRDEDLDDAEVSESEKQTMVSKISKYCITGPNDHGGVQLRLVQVKHEVADGYG